MNEETVLVEKYINLCSLLCKDEEDYSRDRIKIHNKAMAELKRLADEIGADMPLAAKVYETLLYSQDAFIQQSAATDCLQLKIHINQAIKTLKRIQKNGGRMAAMTAKRTLLIWNGKLNPDDPF